MKNQREHWGSKLGFIMATAGSAIGLGSLWRFPYVTGNNGGGLFVILYLLFTFLIALPVFIGELIIGRSAQKSAVQAYEALSRQSNEWRLLGWVNVITSFIILSFYTVISGWCLNYTLMSLMNFTKDKTPEQIQEIFSIMASSGDISLFWNFIFVLINVGVVYAGIRKGIEYWTKILTPALLIILVAMFCFSMTLPGFKQAVHFTFNLDFSKLSPQGVLEALGMAFFTLSVGLGIILTYGSYMKPSEDIPKTGFIVACMTVLISIIGALTIFPIIFTFGFEPAQGAGLIFKTLPILFQKLPGTIVLSTTFFILFVFTALTSSISLFEVLVANLIEVLSWSRKKALFLSATGIFILGIPSALAGSGSLFPNWKVIYGMSFLDTLDKVTGSWMMPISALLTSIFLGWYMDKQLVAQEFVKGTSWIKILRAWIFLIRWLCPVAIVLIILQEGGILDFNKLLTLMNNAK